MLSSIPLDAAVVTALVDPCRRKSLLHLNNKRRLVNHRPSEQRGRAEPSDAQHGQRSVLVHPRNRSTPRWNGSVFDCLIVHWALIVMRINDGHPGLVAEPEVHARIEHPVLGSHHLSYPQKTGVSENCGTGLHNQTLSASSGQLTGMFLSSGAQERGKLAQNPQRWAMEKHSMTGRSGESDSLSQFIGLVG